MNNAYIPNTASIPNIFFDHWMAKLTPAEFKLLMAIARKTYGWNKKKDRISLRQLTELTGLNKSSVVRSTEDLVNMGLVLKFKTKGDYGDLPNEYEINVDYIDKGVAKNGGGSRISRQGVVALCDTPRVASCDTQNPLLTKPTIQKEIKEAAPPPRPLSSVNVERMEHVHTSNEEHEKLVKTYGAEKVAEFYSILSDWKKDTPRSKWKKNDYRSILRWVIKVASEKTKKPSTSLSENLEFIKKIFIKLGSIEGITYGNEYIEFSNGMTCKHFRIDEKDFKEKVTIELKKRKLSL